ncbi:hypothetical protein [Paraburkholderia sp.]|uniref:hypothetical protein n=1 Tax=Paraburkholderia sp. TaxID=1926495 RepID=UPI00239034C5|nr:hypothetical protein [Paraburkholderia sp.]MDE1182304.1 hypothetical protein [Paraburkholderia sp.]
MAKTIPFSRNTRGAQARMAKTMLLPIPRRTADELALRAHVALDALRRGKGCIGDAQAMTQAMLLAVFLAELGYENVTAETLGDAERAIASTFDAGRESGEWRLDDTAVGLFAVIVTGYDRQLMNTPLWAISEASDRLDRFQVGEDYRVRDRKWA